MARRLVVPVLALALAVTVGWQCSRSPAPVGESPGERGPAPPVPNSPTVSPQPQDSQEALFNWFDGLGYTDKLKGKIVLIEWRDEFDPTKVISSSYAIVLNADPKHFKVIDFTLDEEGGDGPFWRPVKKVDPVQAMQEELKRQSEFRKLDHSKGYPNDMWFEALIPFVWARYADLHGQPALAKQFIALASEMMGGEPLLPAFKEELGTRQILGIVYSFGDLKLSWGSLRKKLEWFIEHFPEFGELPVAKELLKAIDETVTLEERPRSADPIDKLIDALVYDIAEGKNTPASKLVAMSRKAVPKLIDALTDRRLTRRLYGRNPMNDTAERVYRVGFRANEILAEIAAKQFNDQDFPSLEGFDDHMRMVKANVLAWWKTVGTGNEEASLAASMLGGGNDASNAAERLAAKYPNTYLATLRKVLADQKGYHLHMLMPLAKMHTVAATSIARDAMLHDKELATRVFAAMMLDRTHHDEVVSAMIREWQRFEPEMDWDSSGLADFVPNLGSAAAIKAVQVGFGDHALNVRRDVLNSLSEGVPRDTLTDKPRRVDKKSRAYLEYRDAVEALLVSALQDKMGVGGMDGLHLSPRLCDTAAEGLANLLPARYKFVAAQSFFERDVQCAKMANVWRAKHGLPPLRLPRPPSVPVPPMFVREVYVSGKWVPSEVRSALESWKGSTLTIGRVLALFQLIEAKLNPAAPGFIFSMERDLKDIGFQVCLEAKGPSMKGVDRWEFMDTGQLGSQGLMGSGASFVGTRFQRDEDREKWSDAWGKVLAAPAKTPTELRLVHHRAKER